MSTRTETNWEEKLEPDERATRRERGRELEVVLLKGLQRLAEEAGLVWSDVQILTPSPKLIQAIYRVRFNDDFQTVGTADCSEKNTTSPFSNYPTAVAESRAEARALRKALGIRLLSSEEVGFQETTAGIETDPAAGVSSAVVKSIESLMESRNIDAVTLLEAVVPKRADSIFELTQLTAAEGTNAMRWLNEQKPAKHKKKSAGEERAARKKELQGKK